MLLPPLIDYHVHIDLYPDYQEVFAECKKQSINTLAVTTTPRAWERNVEMAGGSTNIRVGLGLHPQVVAQFYSEIAIFEKHLARSRFVGEVGLDASSNHYSSFPRQKEIFERVLRLCAEQKGKVLSIHSVRASREVLDLLEKHLLPDRGKAVLHWFSGSAPEAERAVKLGCYFSVNGQTLQKESGCAVLRRLPLTRLLTETDGPFTLTKGKPTRPSDVEGTVVALAALFKMEEPRMRQILNENLQTLES